MKNHLHVLFLCIGIISVQAQVPQLWGTMQFGGLTGTGTIIKINGDGTGFSKVFSFTDGSPQCTLLPKDATHLLGMSRTGGANFQGDIFLYNVSSGGYTILYSLDSSTGFDPHGSLVKANDDNLYGTTTDGGNNNMGVLFRFNPLTFTYTKLHDFDDNAGRNPYGNVMQATNGKLYGMASSGGGGGGGVIFSYDLATSTFADVHDFVFTTGSFPYGNLIQASNGLLYGLTHGGGSGGFGTIFSFDPSTNTYTLLKSLSSTDGSSSYCSLMQATNGLLYGMTTLDGAHGDGTIFSFNTTGNTFTKLHDFDDATGSRPFGSLMQASDGKLYGMTSSGGANNAGAIFSFNISGSVYTNIHDCVTSTGTAPYADLIEYYGTTGVGNPLTKDFISVFPAISDGNITIEFSSAPDRERTLEIITPLGRELLEIKMTQKTMHLQLNYSPGIYFLSLSDEDAVVTKKFVIR